ncbi:MAG: poly-gamma-glutamate system protein [Candidatus Cloacimonetes bacterium]|nr:poly-gamma-glutamate system protein [Candidatus Cloacimonadota bacterium]
MYRPTLRTDWSLIGLALLSLILFYFAQNSHRTIKASYYEEKIQAANEMQSMMNLVKNAYDEKGLNYNILDDPNKTGLIGKAVTSITTSRGILLDKQTAINPNLAAVYVELLKKSGVKKGNYVAVGITGSTPANNLALYAAMKVLEVKPVIITANSSSMFGANRENFTWLDIESYLLEKGAIDFKSSFASLGGNEDLGKGLTDIGLRNLEDSITRNGVNLIKGASLKANINLRMEAYNESIPKDTKYKAFVNIGSGLANVGSAINARLVRNGVNRKLAEKQFSSPGVMFDFAKKGIPVIHTFRIIPLAEEYDLPVAVDKSEKPIEIQKPGIGKIFSSEVQSITVIAICFVILLIAIILVVLFDRHDRKFAKNIVAHED